jgi:hypothetical protein
VRSVGAVMGAVGGQLTMLSFDVKMDGLSSLFIPGSPRGGRSYLSVESEREGSMHILVGGS